MVGAVGVEPTTNGLKGRCSATELRPSLILNILHESDLPHMDRADCFRFTLWQALVLERLRIKQFQSRFRSSELSRRYRLSARPLFRKAARRPPAAEGYNGRDRRWPASVSHESEGTDY